MTLDKKTMSLAALATTIALVAVYFPRQSSELAQLAETASDSRPVTSAATRFDLRTFTVALTEQERALLAELQQDFNPEELERVFNPQTSKKWHGTPIENDRYADWNRTLGLRARLPKLLTYSQP